MTLRVPGALRVATRETALARRETSEKRARVLLSERRLANSSTVIKAREGLPVMVDESWAGMNRLDRQTGTSGESR